MDKVAAGALRVRKEPAEVSREDILDLLNGEQDAVLFQWADQVRARVFGDEVQLRGIIEFSNHCAQNCLYCGLRRDNLALERYRMGTDEILESSRQAASIGLKTIVLQSGEDSFYSADMLAGIISRLKDEHDVAVTVSVGERPKSDYRLMRKAGADRYLLKHETADPELFSRLRPGTTLQKRLKSIGWLRELGFQVGSGNMVGLPGQTLETLAQDILLMRELDVEMAGIGPFIPHHNTPLRDCVRGDVSMTLRVLAVARFVLPLVHLPATTALASIDPRGHELALERGANVIMPDMTPARYRQLYEIYPNKKCISEELAQCIPLIRGMLEQMGKKVSDGYGDSPKPGFARRPRVTRKETTHER
jgi:biotin synthase